MTTIQILPGLCRVCDACVPVCPHLALRVVDGALRWDPDACQGCAVCVVACPARALIAHSDRSPQ